MTSYKFQILILILFSYTQISCGNPPKARAPERLDSEKEFVETCEKKRGSFEQQNSSDAIKLWFQEEFASEISCKEIWEFYNTSDSPLPLGLRSSEVSDISILSHLPKIVSLNLDTAGVNDWSALAGLSKLESLRIQDPKLTRLPDSLIGKNIKKLVVSASPVENFEVLGQISSLEEVVFENMQLTSVPSELEASKQLTRLRLQASTADSYQPLAKLTSLISLSITRAKLERVPASIQDLTLLSFLDLSGNLLSAEDSLSSLADNKSIRELNLANSNLTRIALSGMSALQILDLSSNPQLAALNAYDDFSPNLEGLKLNANELKQIPSSLTKLSELFALDISNNQIEDLSPLANLNRLEILSVEENPVSDPSNYNPATCPSQTPSLALRELCSALSEQ